MPQQMQIEKSELAEKPKLSEPFPNIQQYWTCSKTGLIVPKYEDENMQWREKLLKKAENDTKLQKDLLTASASSLLYWINTFVMTYHQFDVDEHGNRIDSPRPHVPFITWEIQDELFDLFEYCLPRGKDILIDKSRDMGASWICVAFLHWLWLFDDKAPQLLEMSRTESYVDQTGNMKALFQKHDYINGWLPEWMLPPECLVGQKYRTKLHMLNVLTGACIDGESTTEHAASGDRRKVILLDEFAKVQHGKLMRSATRDAGLMRIVNSTPFGAGTEYSRWKLSEKIKVFILPFYEHPQKGKGRYLAKKEDGSWQIRSPWYDEEDKVRTKQEMAMQVDRCDIESGEVVFSISNIDVHMALYARPPKSRHHVNLDPHVPNIDIPKAIQRRDIKVAKIVRDTKGPLRIWPILLDGRLDQTKTYIFGIDTSKGMGASESVVSIKCKETNEKVGEWRDANTLPYDFARLIIALAIWVGGRKPRNLPFLKWENNGPGWELGKLLVKVLKYPYFYRNEKLGLVVDKKSQQYGYQMNKQGKHELLGDYDRALAQGTYVNHSEAGLEQAKLYVHYSSGGCGPSELVEENDSARKLHGDIVIADALTIDDKELPRARHTGPKAPKGSSGWRRDQALAKMRKKKKGWHQPFNFGV